LDRIFPDETDNYKGQKAERQERLQSDPAEARHSFHSLQKWPVNPQIQSKPRNSQQQHKGDWRNVLSYSINQRWWCTQ